MKVEVLMPKMGESITEGKVVKWHKKAGEKIERDEILLEISTDKVDTEIPSSASGILSKILIEEQETAQVGAVIAYIETEMNGGMKQQEHAREKVLEEVVESGERMRETADRLPVGHNGDRFYSPLVKNIAKAEGISENELTSIRGSGSSGRITKYDLMNYIENRGHRLEVGYSETRGQSQQTRIGQ